MRSRTAIPRLTAQVVPYSSVVGQIVSLIGDDGAVYAMLAIRGLRGDVPYTDGQRALADWLVDRINGAAP